MVWNVHCPVVIVAMAKRVTMTTVPVGATVMQVYKVTGVRTVSHIFVGEEIDKYLDLFENTFGVYSCTSTNAWSVCELFFCAFFSRCQLKK